MKLDLKGQILERVRFEGFDVAGFARAVAPAGAADALADFLARGHHGDMAWMENARRSDAALLWPEARSVIALGMSYAPGTDPLAALARKERGTISVYAQGDDYHDVIKKRLKACARWLSETHGGEVKVFVDTAPVMEKPLSHAAGIGWQGKHTNLVSREFGSWLFLGSVFTTLDLEPDPPESDHCGTCQACLDVCPTQAFPAPYRLDARRCISYLTIEHKGHIAGEFRAAIGNRIYGCDDCLAVCPWNKFASRTRQIAFHPRAELTAPRLADLAMLDDAGFRELFRASPIKRIGRDRFVRNVLIAVGNSGDSSLAATALHLCTDDSPLVRAMAAWALKRLVSGEVFTQTASRRIPLEPDPNVRSEWT
jgi:epoxyqueuosine reductase